MNTELTDYNQDAAREFEEKVKKEAILRMQESQLYSLDAIQKRDREIIECEREIARGERRASKALRWYLFISILFSIGLLAALLWRIYLHV